MWRPPPAAIPWHGPDAGPATRAARPAAPRPLPIEDPPTDPYGFRPVPVLRPGPAELRTPPPAGETWSTGPPCGADPVDRAAAVGLAAAFAVDYLSWDEDDPERRGRVLRSHLRVPGDDPARLGWSGRGRQRAELAFPGAVGQDAEGRLIVEVRVRVTPYRSIGEHGRSPADDGEPGADGTAAAAPAPSERGWRGLASRWVQLSVPVVRDGDRLAVEMGAGPG